MLLELNLVKSPSVDAKVVKFISRSRVQVTDDATAIAAIEKFIGENMSTFTAALTDKVLLDDLQNLRLTITKFQCLRYILATKGLDIWAYYVKDDEVDAQEIPSGLVEYNVIDTALIYGNFLPVCTKFTQTTTENSLVKLYQSIIQAYGLFEDPLFAKMSNPLKTMVEAMRVDENMTGTVSTMKTTYVNSILEFLKKEVKVITD